MSYVDILKILFSAAQRKERLIINIVLDYIIILLLSRGPATGKLFSVRYVTPSMLGPGVFLLNCRGKKKNVLSIAKL